MNEKQIAEVDFWHSLFNKLGKDDFLKLRENDYIEKTKRFTSLHSEIGTGLDLGCGMVSIFEYSPLIKHCLIFALDPLLDEYRKILPFWDYVDDGGGIVYEQANGEDIPFWDETFNWACCINVLDHTPNPIQMLKEIERVLKVGGTLYIHVNFDPELYAAHYYLVDWDKFFELIDNTNLSFIASDFQANTELPGQSAIWATFRKEYMNV